MTMAREVGVARNVGRNGVLQHLLGFIPSCNITLAQQNHANKWKFSGKLCKRLQTTWEKPRGRGPGGRQNVAPGPVATPLPLRHAFSDRLYLLHPRAAVATKTLENKGFPIKQGST